MTATTNQTLTAAQWNTNYRDNMLETEAAKATAAPEVATDPDSATEIVPGTWFVATAANAIAERRITEGGNSVGSADTTASTSYTDLDDSYGPSITVVTGTAAIVMITSELRNTTATTNENYVDFDVSGATSRSASDTTALISGGYSTSSADVNRRSVFTRVSLTAGTNVFTMKYRVSGGTGSFRKRQILVWPI
jgi:protein involved in temperature-dependent protein secretion